MYLSRTFQDPISNIAFASLLEMMNIYNSSRIKGEGAEMCFVSLMI